MRIVGVLIFMIVLKFKIWKQMKKKNEENQIVA